MTNMSRARIPVFLLTLIAPTLVAQVPVISPGGLVNGADFKTDPQWGTILIGGEIATIFGANLAATTQSAPGFPLPTSLGGTTVTVGGVAAPLFYVSPGQINLQVPSTIELPGSQTSTVVVTTPAGTSNPESWTPAASAPALFTQNESGCGPGAIQNVSADGSVTLNTPANSVSPGDFITLWATGLGPPGEFCPGAPLVGCLGGPGLPPDGSPAAASPPTVYFGPVLGITVGLNGFAQVTSAGSGAFFPTSFVGLAPGLVGVDQMNVQLPDDAPEGCSVPLTIPGWGFLPPANGSQPVTISIHQGGGPCQDTPLARVGMLSWTKTIVTGPTSNTPVVTDTFQATLVEAPGNLLAPAPSSLTGFTLSYYPPNAPNCPGSSGRRLDAGSMTIQAAGGASFTLSPSSASGELLYQATLPAGILQPGTIQLSASGGADIGAFQASLSFPAPIQIQTNLAPGTIVPINEPFRLDWTGGTADEIVTVRLVGGESDQEYYQGFATGDAGTVTLQPPSIGYTNQFPLGFGRIDVLVTPVQPQTFTAPTLSQPGTQNWMYWYKFTGIVN
jgi:uncharacterized protein (TIGR03437 family)